MKSARSLVGLVGAVALLAGTLGCDAGADRKQIEALQARNMELERQNEDLLGQLAAAHNARPAPVSNNNDQQLRDYQNRLRDLEQQLAAARSELANRPTEPVDAGDGWQEFKDIAWVDLDSDILFDSGEVKIKPGGMKSIQDAARKIQQEYPDRQIWVVGHTDNEPLKRVAEKFKDNLDLSQERGRVVALELANLGIDRSRITAGGQGEYNPIAGNDSRAHKAKNRRVEIIAIRRPEKISPATARNE